MLRHALHALRVDVNRAALARRAAGAALLVALALPAIASADPTVTTITGHASGITVRTGNGAYLVVGTYRDSLGFPGTYTARYHEDTTGYNSCRGVGFGEINCDNPPNFFGLPYRCNLISG